MQRNPLFVALAAALFVGACGTTDPTAPVTDGLQALETEVAYSQGARVLKPGESVPEGYCVKIVPASGNAAERAGERTIVKPPHEETGCPEGFEEPLGQL